MNKGINIVQIGVAIIIIILVWKIASIFLNVFGRIEKATRTEEEKESELDTSAADFLNPYTFTKYFKTANEIKKHLYKYGLSTDAISKIADGIWDKGFGTISDDESYIYQQIRAIPTKAIVSMLSYNLKKRYKMGLDELISRNLDREETKIILNIINKKPTK